MGTGSRRSRSARASSRSATSSRRRVRCSSRWCTSPTSSGFETLDAPRLLAGARRCASRPSRSTSPGRELDGPRAGAPRRRARRRRAASCSGPPARSPATATAAAISVSAVAVALVYRRRPSTWIAIADRGARRQRVLGEEPARHAGARHRVVARRRRAGGSSTRCSSRSARSRCWSPRPRRGASRTCTTTRSSTTSTRPANGKPGRELQQARSHLPAPQHLPRRARRRRRSVTALVPPRPARARPRRPDRAEPRTTDGAPATDGRIGVTGGAPRILWWWAGLVLVVLLRPGPDVPQPPRRARRAARRCSSPGSARRGGSWSIAAIVTLPFQAWQLQRAPRPRGLLRRRTRSVVDHAARRCPDGAWALSDEPGLVWRAGKAHRSVLRRPVGAAHRLARRPRSTITEDTAACRPRRTRASARS